MITRKLMVSDRWRACSWTTRALYSAIYPFADRDGRVTADRLVLWSSTGASAVIGLRAFSKTIDEMIHSGLYLVGKSMHGKDFLEIYKFSEGQEGFRYDREPAGDWPTCVRETVARSRPKDGHVVAEVEVEVEGEHEVESEVEVEVPARATPTIEMRKPVPTDLPQRLIRLWKELFVRLGMAPPPANLYIADTVAQSRKEAFVFFPTDQLLSEEIQRVCLCCDEKEIPIRFQFVMENVGTVFSGTTKPQPEFMRKAEEKPKGGLAPNIRAMIGES